MIELSGITKSFGTLQVLKGIDLLIGKGEISQYCGTQRSRKNDAASDNGNIGPRRMQVR